MQLSVGDKLGRYEIQAELGSGGSAVRLVQLPAGLAVVATEQQLAPQHADERLDAAGAARVQVGDLGGRTQRAGPSSG